MEDLVAGIAETGFGANFGFTAFVLGVIADLLAVEFEVGVLKKVICFEYLRCRFHWS